jgi:hypothetical protein
MSNDFPAVNRAPASNNPSVSIDLSILYTIKHSIIMI